MERYWNKKQISLLLRGERGSLDTFFNEYRPVLYTWLYYQVGADAQIAADLTGRTFERAMQQLGLFDPHATTMLQWLRDHARAARDEGLLRWQLKPQRPWAWSQLPDKILNSLAVIRSEPLRNSVAENPFVQEIVQASLAEMEQADRELMMHRYSHLDTPDNISVEMNLSVEAVNDLLYKCRHSFRRVFFKLVSSVNPGFTESNAAAGIEVLDSNLEKLLRATGMYQVPSETQEAAIRERFEQAAAQLAGSQLPARTVSARTIAAWAAALCVTVAGVLAGVLWLTGTPAENEPATAVAVPAPDTRADVQTAANAPKNEKMDINEEEFKLILELGQAGQIEPLREFLKSGMFASQIAAAHFIGKLGMPADIDLLEAAERQWYANGPADNPFAAAIHEIAQRYPDQMVIAEPAPEPSAAPNTADNPVPGQTSPTIKGYVRDFSGRRASGAKIDVSVNPLFSGQASVNAAASVTDDKGIYQVAKELSGAYFVKCTSPMEGLQSVREAIWIKSRTPVKCDFGGPSVVTGKVGVNGSPLAGLKLILSDAEDPAKAAFLAEAVAGAEGDFTFSGVRPGIYRLVSLNENKKLICLESSLEIQDNDFLRIDLDLAPVSVIVEYPEPNAVLSAALAYAFDASYEEKKAALLPDGSLQFSGIIAGPYLLRLELTAGVRLEQLVDIQPGVQNQVITAQPLTDGRVTLTGRLIGSASAGLLLETVDRHIQVPVKTAGDGSLELPELPAEFYHLTGIIKGKRIVYTSIDLTSLAATEIELDIDLANTLQGLSPVYAVVTDPQGRILAGASVAIAGDDLTMSESTAQGAFLVAPAGKHILRAELAGYVPREIHLDLNQPLTAEPSKDNLVVIELGR